MRSLVVIFFLLAGLPAIAQTVRHRTHDVEYFPNSNHVKKVTVTLIKRNKFVDLYNYYKLTKVTVTEFNFEGEKLSVLHRTTRQGVGHTCYEVYVSQLFFDPQGRKKHFESSTCDKRESVMKEYKEGKLVFERKHKKLR